MKSIPAAIPVVFNPWLNAASFTAKYSCRFTLAAACGLLLSTALPALAGPKEYPMVGPIIALTDTTLVVQQSKTKETWEFARPADLKGGAGLKVGDCVMIRYTLQAVSAEPRLEKETKAEKTAGAAAGTGSGSPAKPVAAVPAR